MTPSFVSRLAFAFVFALALGAAAQSPPTAGFPVEPAPTSSGSAAAPPPTNVPAPPSSAPTAPSPAPPATPAPTAPVLVAPPPATAAPGPSTVPPLPPIAAAPEPDALEVGPPLVSHQFMPGLVREPIGFEQAPGWAVGIEGRAGLGFLTNSDARGAFAFAGGLLRGHYHYLELGAFYDHADSSESGGTFSHAGGFAGAWLPYHNWVDFDVALGFGVRRYSDSDPRYGPNGYVVNSPALSLQAGVSDRAHSGKAGARVGGQIVLTEDLGQRTKNWTLNETDNTGEVFTTTGTTHVGGFSASLVITIGFDYGESP